MEYIVVLLISVFILMILGSLLGLSAKKIRKIAENDELNRISDDFPSNTEIAKDMLNRLNNNSVKIEEDKHAKNSLYLVMGNKISIASMKHNFARVQTVAHECLHSIQSKRLLWCNFIFSNIYIIYTLVLLVLTIFKVVKPSMVQVAVLLLMGIFHYFVRSMLETDAMIKARYLAKEYMEDNNICSEDVKNDILTEYDKLNDIGIKVVNFDILGRDMLKVILYCLVAVFV